MWHSHLNDIPWAVFQIPQAKISGIRESGFRRWEMRREIYPLESAILLLNYTTYPTLYTPALNKAMKLSAFYHNLHRTVQKF